MNSKFLVFIYFSFMILAIFEWWLCYVKKSKNYDLRETLTSVNCLNLTMLFSFFFYSNFFIMINLYLPEVPFLFGNLSGWPLWIICFLCVDFLYYWQHRLSHSKLLWGFHGVQHQALEVNLFTGFRSPIFYGLFKMIFLFPLIFLGFPLKVILFCDFIMHYYQYLTHRESNFLKIPFFSKIFNTASHHRVHHGINEKYRDKNFAGALIIWDRLFGTFTAEDEKPVYGVNPMPNSYNPIYLNLFPFIQSNNFKIQRTTSFVKERLSWGSIIFMIISSITIVAAYSFPKKAYNYFFFLSVIVFMTSFISGFLLDKNQSDT